MKLSDATAPSKAPQAVSDWAPGEEQRIACRRDNSPFGILRKSAHGENWGLALSGGGIRSATFALGVLQAMARTAIPTASAGATGDGAAAGTQKKPYLLLPQFDYLSTVSGGGFIGSFFCSLFVRGRLSLNPDEMAAQAAARANEVLAYEPPGRMHFVEYHAGDPPGKAPLAWLRDNGRYLSPTGAGDTLYAAALAVRNWASVQYVLGTLFLLVFTLVALLRNGTFWLGDQVPAWGSGAIAAFGNPLWWIPIALIALAVLPIGLAFWLAYVPDGKTEQMRVKLGGAFWITFLLGALVTILSVDAAGGPPRSALGILCAAIGFEMVVACAWFVGALWSTPSQQRTIAYERVRLTRMLQTAMWVTALSAILVAVDCAAAWVYGGLGNWPGLGSSAGAGAVLGALMWLVRQVAKFAGDTKKGGMLAKIPLGVLAAFVAALSLLLVALLWAVVVRWIELGGVGGNLYFLNSLPGWLVELGGLFLVAAVLAFVTARFPAFINVSTFQSLYSARLTRAYLGASNGNRFTQGTSRTPARSVAEPIVGDQVDHDTYYGTTLGDVLAPLHIVNITMNQTVDPIEQLVQRDRKGKPMAVVAQGFSIDDDQYRFRNSTDGIGMSLSMGQWIGASGAAVSTGLGRATSLGASIVLGMANIRLGVWWRSGLDMQPKDPNYLAVARSGFRSAFLTQSLLLDELSAQFHGLRRPWQYLSDGGHFENTGVYELLRERRDVRVIVACDSGADSNYQFEDLANLIRLARIDFRLEIEVDQAIARCDGLAGVFGGRGQLTKGDGRDNVCAMLLNVRRADAPGSDPVARIILLKPRLIAAAPLDVKQYADSHASFPQESTAEQFFDEAQWESYRKLGVVIANQVFGGEAGVALWRYLGALPAAPSEGDGAQSS